MRGRRVLVQAWRVEVGRVPLYLLDTNVDGEPRDRPPHHRPPLRRRPRDALRAGDGLRHRRRAPAAPARRRAARLPPERRPLGLPHAGAGARADRGAASRSSEAAARRRTRCVFTTHTPVAAGHDEFTTPLVEKCFGDGYWERSGSRARSSSTSGASWPTTTRVVRPHAARAPHVPLVERRQPQARRGVARAVDEDVARTPRRRSAHHTRHQRRARADVGLAAAPLRLREHGGRELGRASARARAWAERVGSIPDEELWERAPPSEAPARRLRPPASLSPAGAAGRGAGVRRGRAHGVRRRGSDHRLRPKRCRLQALESHPHRPRPPATD